MAKKTINELIVETGTEVSRCKAALEVLVECGPERHAMLEKLALARKRHRWMIKLYTDPFGLAHQQWVYSFGSRKPSPFGPV